MNNLQQGKKNYRGMERVSMIRRRINYCARNTGHRGNYRKYKDLVVGTGHAPSLQLGIY